VDIEPIHYVYADGWIYGRTSHGAKLTTLEKNRWVAFEVDEVKSLFDWRSAVVHGAVYVLEPDSTAEARATWDHALALLRKLLPATLREDDPVPHRGVVFRIAVQESTGRRAVPPKG
jgi:nitroimidazol reductase NimA-like FMN-containing flavoprotein (pyridoxamine 5'-phosphate oxidase superfamily)